MRLSRRDCLAGLIASGASPALAADARPVDLLLVLAVDASGSVSMERFELQKHGYAEAFRSPDVAQAIASGPAQAIGVAMFQWTGPSLQRLVVPWTAVGDAASAVAFAERLDGLSRELFGGGTSISGAIDLAMRLFAQAPFAAPRRVIDVSGDGRNNSGRPSGDARDDAVAAGVVINGLPILTVEPDLEETYRTAVIGGAGSFVIAIDSYDQFAAAIRRKLVSEIAAREDRRFG